MKRSASPKQIAARKAFIEKFGGKKGERPTFTKQRPQKKGQ